MSTRNTRAGEGAFNMANEVISAEVWWAAIGTLDRAVTYLQHDAGLRDTSWSIELQEATELLQHKADKLRARAVKLEGGR